MRSIAARVLAAFLLPCVCLLPASRGASAEQVQTAIEKATKYIYSQLHDDNWEVIEKRDPKAKPSDTHGGQWGGLTALSIYALLAAGESPQDPRLAKAIEWLRKADLVGTYAIALRAQVWLNIPKTDLIRRAMARDAKFLLFSQRTTGPNTAEFTYMNQGPSGPTDHSNSQYGVLGLWACSDVVETIPDTFWTQADASWRADQGADGSWSYELKPGMTDQKGKLCVGSPNMTAAGIATLFITQDFLDRDHAMECSGNIDDKNIDAGIQWMSAHFNDVLTDLWSLYGLYGIERIGVASGYKYLGDVDWYEKGSDFLINAQNPDDGSFKGTRNSNIATTGALVNTCFGLLFLSRGRAPVMMNKLDYNIADMDSGDATTAPANATPPKQANWNERPRDAFNIAHWVGKETENTLNWQVSTLDSPVEDWHDAPILYITGDDALSLTLQEEAKLKQFVEDGGLILGSADCGKKAFADSFRRLGNRLFPNYEFTPLSANDTIMHDEQFNAVKWRHRPTVLAIANGARKLMLLIPDADPAKAWQMQQTGGKEELFELAANIYLYAVDKNGMTVKGDSYIAEPDPAVKPLNTITVARIIYDGNWNPEPGGWRRLNAVMHNADSLDVKTLNIDPGIASLANVKIAHLTGTDRFHLSVSAIAALQQFIKDGGTLIVDADGGRSPFADSAEQMLHAIFGDDADQLKTVLPDDSPLYSAGGPLGDVSYRYFAHATLRNLKAARLRGIKQDGRLVCIFSPEDLSTGLVGEPVDGIYGYSPSSATALARKMLLMITGDQPVKPPVVVKPRPKRPHGHRHSAPTVKAPTNTPPANTPPKNNPTNIAPATNIFN